jgi:hypothetical protein
MGDHVLSPTAGAMVGLAVLAGCALQTLVTLLFVVVRNPDRLYRCTVRLAARLWTKDGERAEIYAEEWQAIGEELHGRLPKVRMALSFLTFGAVRRVADTVRSAGAMLAEGARRTARPIHSYADEISMTSCRRAAAMSRLARIGELGIRRWRAFVTVTIVVVGAVYCGMAMGNQLGWVPVVTILGVLAATAVVLVAASEAVGRR